MYYYYIELMFLQTKNDSQSKKKASGLKYIYEMQWNSRCILSLKKSVSLPWEGLLNSTGYDKYSAL